MRRLEERSSSGALVRTSLATILLVAVLARPTAASADPLEPFNRLMFAFNAALVEQVVNPTVDHVAPHVPEPVVTGLGNMYSNLTEVEFLLNAALAGDGTGAAVSVGRFAVNSTAGIVGLFDVATPLGLVRTERDFVESLCKTGLPPGPYLVLPFVGPTNLYSAGVLAGAVALEVYALSFISTVLAAADFIIIDLGGSASALRYARDVPTGATADSYAAQRDGHLAYVARGCGAAEGPAETPIVSRSATTQF